MLLFPFINRPLRHELYGSRQLLPPSTKVSFKLKRSEDGWYLCKPANVMTKDSEKYKVKIESCVLLVKVCTLTEPVYNSFKARFQKELIIYHYRRLSMKTLTISPHSILFESGSL